MRAYPPPSFVFLAFLGAEIAGGQNMPPPSRARNSQTLSRGRANHRPVFLLGPRGAQFLVNDKT